MERKKGILNHLEYIHEWSSAEKTRLIALIVLFFHGVVFAVSLYLYHYTPSTLNLEIEVIKAAYNISAINIVLSLVVLVWAHLVFSKEEESADTIYLGIILLGVTICLNASFMGIFDGYTWLLVYILFALGCMILPERIVYFVAAFSLAFLAVMTFLPELFPFPIRPYSLSNISDVSEMSHLDRLISWVVLSFVALSAFWINSFLLRAARVREEDLKSKSYIDQLTSILNRRAVMERLSEEFSRARRAEYKLSLAMIDLDHFKMINDTYGHQLGDKALVHVAKHLKDIVRKTDLVSRFGGEEFLVVFPDCTMANAKVVLDRLRHNIASDPVLSQEGRDIKLTFSAGITELRDADIPIRLEEIISRADEALYEAKNTGRNKVIIIC